MGQYDIPAVLDFITLKTGVKKTAYVGHSQGTTQMFYALSEPGIARTMNEKVSVFVAVGPVTKVSHATSTVINMAADLYVPIDHFASLFGVHELLGQNWFTSSACKLFCNAIPSFCAALTRLFISSNPKADDLDRF